MDSSDWNVPLSEIFPDSITYVSAVVEIESRFNVALPDVFFSSIDECSLTSLENTILSLIAEQVQSRNDSTVE